MFPTLTSWIGCTVALLLLLPQALTWRRTVSLYGRVDRRLIRQMLHLCRYTGHRWIVILSFLLIGWIAWITLAGMPVPPGVMATVVAVALVPLLRVTLPPGILFLAGSGQRATGLLSRLHRSAVSLRVVAGLDYRWMGPFGGMIRLDITRATNDSAWRSVVSRLIDIAPLIVIDTVGRTGPCRYEASLVSTPERIGRTVFVCDENGRCPSLEAEGIDPAEHAVPVIYAEDLEKTVRDVLRRSGPPPTGRTIPSRVSTPIIEENWKSLPSMSMIALVDGLDGRFLLAHARNSDKDVIGLLTPHSSVDEATAKASKKLLWEFPRNPRLVGLFLETSGVTLVRRDFLLKLPQLLDLHVEGIRPGQISMEDLNRPEPITAAVYKLCIAWSKEAKRRGLEFRFVQK